jgi:hypothetical protein
MDPKAGVVAPFPPVAAQGRLAEFQSQRPLLIKNYSQQRRYGQVERFFRISAGLELEISFPTSLTPTPPLDI